MKTYIQSILVILISLLLISGTVYASSTISTNIQTDGTLSVTGQSVLTGNVGISSTTPGSVLAIGTIGGINFSPVATSTFGSSANGINLNNGCFAINNVCVGGNGGGGSGTVTPGTAGQVPYYASNGSTLTATSSILIAPSGYVGFYGATNPDAPIKIGSGTTASVDAQIVIARSVDDTTGPITTGNGHAFSDSSSVTRSGTMAYNSYDARTLFGGTSDYNHYAAFQDGMTYSSSGTLGLLYGVVDNPAINGTGNVGTRYGFQAGDVSLGSTGRPTNNIGFDCNADFTAGSGGNWCFYAGGKSNFMGGLLLGSSNTFYNADFVQLQLTASAANTTLRLLQQSQNFWDISAVANTSRFGIKDIAGTEYFSILNGGNVGIGTTSPRSLLHVDAGASATTTVEFGDQYSTASKTCFNAKNTAGASVSFYIVGMTMTVEANRCR